MVVVMTMVGGRWRGIRRGIRRIPEDPRRIPAGVMNDGRRAVAGDPAGDPEDPEGSRRITAGGRLNNGLECAAVAELVGDAVEEDLEVENERNERVALRRLGEVLAEDDRLADGGQRLGLDALDLKMERDERGRGEEGRRG